MKVSGFTFVRNAIKFDYPIVEAILSILPICDEVIVAVGNSEDDTLQLIQSIDSPKIKIIETIWNENLREGGKVLADETNKAFAAISPDSEWAFYIQGDEVVHEQYLPVIQQAMLAHKDNPKVEGLLFKYLHFYGSYHYVADSRQWYRHEIRVIRNRKDITSYRDAQGFRTTENKKLYVKPIDAYIYHYGWVREPFKQQKRAEINTKYWIGNRWQEKKTEEKPFDYYAHIDSLALFKNTAPEVMKQRIAAMTWTFEPDLSKKKLSLKNKFHYWIEKIFGVRLAEYKNYKLI
jgi:glycosyltransferase involved in cell wall biosynthesis